jgi:hypothetical protein
MQACWQQTPRPRWIPDTNHMHVIHCSAMMAAHADLRASALLALTKLMAIEPHFCDANLRLLFTLLHNRRAAGLVHRCLPHGQHHVASIHAALPPCR